MFHKREQKEEKARSCQAWNLEKSDWSRLDLDILGSSSPALSNPYESVLRRARARPRGLEWEKCLSLSLSNASLRVALRRHAPMASSAFRRTPMPTESSVAMRAAEIVGLSSLSLSLSPSFSRPLQRRVSLSIESERRSASLLLESLGKACFHTRKQSADSTRIPRKLSTMGPVPLTAVGLRL